MRARAKSLPSELQHINTCRIRPIDMDALRVQPGDLLLVQKIEDEEQHGNMIAEREIVSSRGGPIHSCKNGLVRLWVRCRRLSRCLEMELQEPQIELDPDFMAFLNITDGTHVIIKPHIEPEYINTVTFITTSLLSEEQKSALKQCVRMARWPIYPGAFFAINLWGEAVGLKLSSSILLPSVISSATVVSIQDMTVLGELEKERSLLIAEMSLQQAHKDLALLLFETDRIEKANRILQGEIARDEAHIRALSEELQRLRKELSSLPDHARELSNNLEELVQENNRLREQTTSYRFPENFDLPKKQEEYKSVKDTVLTVLTNLEKVIQNE